MTFDERNAMTCLKDLKFKAEDFELCQDLTGAEVAAIANRILKEKLERAPEVFATEWSQAEGQWNNRKHSIDTHKARLVCIKPIKE